MMSAISDDQYERLKKFVGLFYIWHMARPHHSPSSNPLVVLDDLEKKSAAQARRGLGMAVNDCVEISSDWSPEQVAQDDKRFIENGSPSLSEVRKTYSTKYIQILKRGYIKSLREYHLVKGVVDGGGAEAGAGETEKLVNMLTDYENRQLLAPRDS